MFVAVLPDDNITTAEVLKVIRKNAQSLDDRVGIPARLVLDPISFDGSTVRCRNNAFRLIGNLLVMDYLLQNFASLRL